MKKVLIVLSTVLFLWSCNNNTSGQTPDSCKPLDAEVAKKVVIDYFDAIAGRNYDDIRNISVDNLEIFENGILWTNDSLINFLENFPADELSYDLTNFKVQSDCNSALVTYSNQGLGILEDSTRLDFFWIESAHVKMVDGEPKLAFLHSTAVTTP